MNRDIGAADHAVAVSVAGGNVALAKTRALFVGGAGDVVVTMADGGNVTFTCAAGQILPIGVVAVIQAGTDASGIVALY